jgi:Multiubiquitin
MSHTSQPNTNVILNMEKVGVPQQKLTYAQLVHLAYPGDPPADDSDIVYTISVTYPDGVGDTSVSRGSQPVNVKEGMVINVRKTGRS